MGKDRSGHRRMAEKNCYERQGWRETNMAAVADHRYIRAEDFPRNFRRFGLMQDEQERETHYDHEIQTASLRGNFTLLAWRGAGPADRADSLCCASHRSNNRVTNSKSRWNISAADARYG